MKEWIISSIAATVIVSGLGLAMYTYEQYGSSEERVVACGEYKQIMVAGKLQTIRIDDNCIKE